MPRKSTKSKKTYKGKKKTYRKANVQRTMVHLGEGFPKMIKCTHRYSETIRMTNTVGSLAIQRFLANGMYKPNYTSSGHQPMYTDQMQILYNKYHIIGSKIFVSFIHTGSGVPTDCMVLLDDDTTSSSLVTTLMEQTNAKYKIMSYGNSAPKVITRSYSAKKTHGGSILANDNLQGNATAGTDPIEQNYFTIITSPVDGISNNAVDIVVKIEYIAVWHDMKEVLGS
jgi:hypothetical protein